LTGRNSRVLGSLDAPEVLLLGRRDERDRRLRVAGRTGPLTLLLAGGSGQC
jgi:hypothetical protein